MFSEFQHHLKFPLPFVTKDEVGIRAQLDPTSVRCESRLNVRNLNSLPKRQEKLHDAAFARRIRTDEHGEGTEFHFTSVLKALEVFDAQFGQHGLSPYALRVEGSAFFL